MSDQPTLPFLTRLWFAYVVFFRVLFNGEYAAQLHSAKALPEAKSEPKLPPKAEPKAEPKPAKPEPAPPPSHDAALQLLALLQREGRFVDFLEEDVASFADADIGAAARVVHAGCRKALREHVKLEPVRSEEEGARVTLEGPLDAGAVKLTGNVQGKGPYSGTLRHRGWKAADITMPTAVEGHDARILAQAEVELWSTPRYVVGIDLGTTHTALAYAPIQDDATQPPGPVEVLGVPQLVAQGTVESRELLPSFFYVAHESDGPQALPWDKKRTYVVGEHARARGVDAPARVITSAKSWLCHPTVDRRGAILPAGAPEDVERISPVEASWRYLEHLIEAWDHVVAKGDPELALSKQSVVLTVPASFDAAARELTTEAAYAAGLEELTLLEEPQAAFYAWLALRGDEWRKDVKVGDAVLVVDVGGGTTDFSVIAAVEKDGQLALERVAVGDHILLGGDNMDLLLAHVVEQKMVADAEAAGKTLELDRWQRVALQHAARGAKEKLLGDSKAKTAPIAIAGKGSKLVGSTLRAELTRDEVTRAIVDGFFPVVDAEARPATRARAALTQLGLPYAQDPAVTKHLAALLARHADALGKVSGGTKKSAAPKMLHPTRILFNGGVMKSGVLRERLVSCLTTWMESEGAPAPRMLEGTDLDLAVARGAAAYGLARRGRGVRIRGGTGRAYYVGIEGAVPAIPGLEPPVTALCVAPFGMEEGTASEVPGQELGVVVGEKVRFRFFGSSVRRKDAVGTALERWKADELDELAPIEVDLPPEGRNQGDVVPVRLRSSVTEVGTLLLEAVPLQPRKKDERWKVELSVRAD